MFGQVKSERAMWNKEEDIIIVITIRQEQATDGDENVEQIGTSWCEQSKQSSRTNGTLSLFFFLVKTPNIWLGDYTIENPEVQVSRSIGFMPAEDMYVGDAPNGGGEW